jgi:diguanylate cyclase (GGDEF)-like protein/PAS domain S-box-containing protein
MKFKLLQVPDFNNPEKQRRASILVATQVAAVVMMLIVLLISAIADPGHPEVILQALAGVLLVVSSYVLLKKKKLDLAGWIVVVMAWLITTLDLVFISGIQGVMIMGQVLVVMIAGLAVSGQAAIVMTLASIAANLFVLYGAQVGILPAPNPLPANLTRYIIQSLFSFLAAVYVWRADTVIKKAFIQTEAAANRFKSLFDRTNDSVFILDLDWCVLTTNDQAGKLLGFETEELIGQAFSDWYGDSNQKDGRDELNRLLKEEELPVIENIIRTKDEQEIPVAISLALVPDDTGKPQHIQCILRDITARKKYERHLIYEAHHDPLTGLPNRKYFEREFSNSKSRRIEDQGWVAVLFIDIDDFKEINDHYSHAIGDLVLKELAKRLKSSVRETDTVVRVGGDEFLIILENIQIKEHIENVANKLITRIREPFLIGNHSILLTVSIGITITEKEKLSDINLVMTFDSAMYEVKNEGKNDFKFYQEDIFQLD